MSHSVQWPIGIILSRKFTNDYHKILNRYHLLTTLHNLLIPTSGHCKCISSTAPRSSRHFLCAVTSVCLPPSIVQFGMYLNKRMWSFWMISFIQLSVPPQGAPPSVSAACSVVVGDNWMNWVWGRFTHYYSDNWWPWPVTPWAGVSQCIRDTNSTVYSLGVLYCILFISSPISNQSIVSYHYDGYI